MQDPSIGEVNRVTGAKYSKFEIIASYGYETKYHSTCASVIVCGYLIFRIALPIDVRKIQFQMHSVNWTIFGCIKYGVCYTSVYIISVSCYAYSSRPACFLTNSGARRTECV